MTTGQSVPITSDVMPGRNGGTLRRGGGPGRPKVKDEAIAAIRQGLPEVIEALIKKARAGESWAVRTVLEYGIGKPKETVEMTVDIRAAAERVALEYGLDTDVVLAEADRILAAAKADVG